MTTGPWKILVVTLVALTLSLSVAPVNAQSEAAGSSDIIEEILVTARRRSERMKDVPVSMTAFTSQDIESAGIELPHQAIALTPNVTIVQVQNAGNSFVTVRGISQNRNTEPSVATLVDGVLMSNAAQFNQELFDIEQIEILRGAQGAIYGRNAIGGAIIINTKAPTDEFEGRVKAGWDSGPGYKVQGIISGPVGSSDAWKYRAAISYKDTDGYIDNKFLGEEADPYEDLSGRIKLLYQPSDSFSADIRVSFSNLDTQALYYQIRESLPEPPDPLFGFLPHPDPFNESFGHGAGDPNSVNDTSQLVRNNNAGVNERDLTNVSFKFDWNSKSGTFTSITSFDTLEELLTGDAWDFLPIPESAVPLWFGFPDQNQSQWLDLDTFSQEFRFTSSADQRLRYIIGSYLISTNRFISTGAMIDTGGGVFPVFREPRGDFPFDFATDPVNPQVSFLADEQDNFAWAVFGELAYDISDATEVAFSLRYDRDKRQNTTITPTAFLATAPGFPQEGATGQVRTNTWDDLQPKLSFRHIASDSITWYGSLSRGFRSGGFNQTGVQTVALANGFAGIGDQFDQETTDTIEVGFKGSFNNGRVTTNLSAFHTEAEGTYFFIFIAANSTQNLGNLLEAEYTGLEFELSANVADGFDVNLGIGLIDSEVTKSLNPSDVGDAAPNVSEYTVNLGAQYTRPTNVFGGADFFLRADFQIIGDTAFFDNNQAGTNDRDPVNLLDVRAGLKLADDWAVTVWGRNLLDEDYHTEYSTGGFVFKAQPLTWGVEFSKDF